jgi:transposase
MENQFRKLGARISSQSTTAKKKAKALDPGSKYSHLIIECPLVLAKRLELPGQVYFLARAIDKPEGSGWAEIDIKEAAKACGKKDDTIRRNIEWCKRKGLFREVEKLDKGRWRVFYEAQVKSICREAAYTDQGGFAELHVSQGEFHQRTYKAALASVVMKRLQEQNEHALKGLKDQPDPIPAEKIHEATSSAIANGPMSNFVGSTQHSVLVPEDVLVTQASQITAATRFSTSRRTISRHVNRAKEYGFIRAVQIKRVIADEVPNAEIGDQFAEQLNFDQSMTDSDIRFRYMYNDCHFMAGKQFKHEKLVLRYECCAYVTSIEYRSCRSLNRRVKRYAEALADNPLTDLPDRWAKRRSVDKKTGKTTLRVATLLEVPDALKSKPPATLQAS